MGLMSGENVFRWLSGNPDKKTTGNPLGFPNSIYGNRPTCEVILKLPEHNTNIDADTIDVTIMLT